MSAESRSRFVLYEATAPEAKGSCQVANKRVHKEIDLAKEPNVE